MVHLTPAQAAAIRTFAHDFPGSYVRTVRLANELRATGARELRSKKVDHLAAICDELGNTTALCRDGYIRQFLRGEEGGL